MTAGTAVAAKPGARIPVSVPFKDRTVCTDRSQSSVSLWVRELLGSFGIVDPVVRLSVKRGRSLHAASNWKVAGYGNSEVKVAVSLPMNWPCTLSIGTESRQPTEAEKILQGIMDASKKITWYLRSSTVTVDDPAVLSGLGVVAGVIYSLAKTKRIPGRASVIRSNRLAVEFFASRGLVKVEDGGEVAILKERKHSRLSDDFDE